MSILHRRFPVRIPGKIGFWITAGVLSGICAGHVLAQSTLEYLTLQGEVQGGMQQGMAKDAPADTGTSSFSNQGRTNSRDAWTKFFSDRAGKITPLQLGAIFLLILFVWFLMRG